MILSQISPRSFFDQVDDLGSYQMQEAKLIERPRRVATPVRRLGRADVWPPEVLAEIQSIYAQMEQP